MFGLKTRNWMMIGLAACLILLVAGCGGNGGGNGDNASPSPSAPPASPQADAGGGSPAPSAAPDDGEGVPATIAVTYFPYADLLFALGQADKVKGVANLDYLKNFTVYDSILSGGAVEDLGLEANLEKVAAMNPDLIIASPNEEKIADQLGKIARTVTVPSSLDWKQSIGQIGALVGQEDAAKAYIDNFDKKTAEVAALAEQNGVKGKTALFIMPWKKGFTYWSGSRMGFYYDGLGFKPFDGLENVGEITLEGISELNPEYIFIGDDYTKGSEITLEDLKTNAVWQSLDAAKNGHIFHVDTEILGPLAMGQSKGLDYMEQLMKNGMKEPQ